MQRFLNSVAITAVLVASLPIMGAPRAQAQPTSAPASVTQMMSGAQVDAYLTAAQFRGYILLERHGQIILSKGYGMADVEHKVPNTIHTRWPMFGIEGFMIAMATLKLQEEGKLNVKDKLCRYIRGCPSEWKPITLGMLLTGTSGIGFYQPLITPGTIEQSLATCEALPMASDPGTLSPDDSPCNRLLLSTILARVSGKSFSVVMQETIFHPAGMTSTGFAPGATAPAWSVHGYNAGVLAPLLYVNDFPLIYASVADVQRLDHALLAGKIISPQSLRALSIPRICNSVPNDVPWCLGYGGGVDLANKFPTFSLAPTTLSSPLKTNRVIAQGSGGPDGYGFSLQNLLSPDDGALAIMLVNDPGLFPGNNEDWFRDHTVQLLWAK